MKAFNVKRRTRHKIVSAVASFMLIGLAFTEGTAPAQADYIDTAPKANLSKYSPFVDWIDWTDRDDDPALNNPTLRDLNLKAGGVAASIVEDRPYHTKSVRAVGDSQLVTRCMAKVVYSEQWENSKGRRENVPLNFHAPGGYAKDPFDDFYGGGHLVGIGRGKRGQSAMDISCQVTLEKPGESPVAIPIQGLVFADGESTNRGNYKGPRDKKKHLAEREFFEVTPHVPNGRDFNWKFLEYKPGAGCSNNQGHTEVRRGSDYGNYRKKGKGHGDPNFLWNDSMFAANDYPGNFMTEDNLRVRGFDEPCKTRQPFVNVFAEGADGAYIDLNGAGGNYVAIGVVLGADFGDAITSLGNETKYQSSGAVVTPAIKGGIIPKLNGRTINRGDDLDREAAGTDRVKRRDEDMAEHVFGHLEGGVPAISYDVAPYIGAHGPDSDITSDMSSNNFISDDTSEPSNSTVAHPIYLPEEDGLGDQKSSLLVSANAGAKYELSVPCKAKDEQDVTTYVQGWLDWNGDGQFSDDEAAYGDAVGQKATCAQGDGRTAKLHWSVTKDMLPTSDERMVRSALRLLATTDANASFTGVAFDGEVEDHAVTLVRPQLTLNKQFVDTQADSARQAQLRTGWDFTADPVPAADGYQLIGANDSSTARTNADGNAMFDFQQTMLAGQDYLPLDATTANAYPVKTFSLGETPKDHYGLADFTDVACTVPSKPTGWGLPGNADAYPWPATPAVLPSVSSAAGKLTVSNFSATSVASCQVNNKPDGVFKITPKVALDASVTGSAPTFDPNLQFAGTWTCDVNGKSVTGHWGPVAAGQSWEFTSNQENSYQRIPLGSSCSVTQTALSTSDGGDSQKPVKTGTDKDQYSWGTVTYTPAGTPATSSAAVTVGNADTATAVPEIQITNQVVKQSKTFVTWTKVDEADRYLEGAEFSLAGPSGFTTVPVTDCVANSATQCTGADKDPKAGQFKVVDIPVGDGYQLTETKAPLGYQKTTIDAFNVKQTDIATGKDLGKIVNKPYSSSLLPGLPITGGTATDIFLILGGVIGAMSLTLAIAAKRRNNQSRS